MLASNTVLPYCLAIYQSKENGGDSDKPLDYRVVTSSLSPCANPSDHHVFFDNFFSSYQLMKILSGKGFKAKVSNLSSRQNKWLPIEVRQRIQENGQMRLSVFYIR